MSTRMLRTTSNLASIARSTVHSFKPRFLSHGTFSKLSRFPPKNTRLNPTNVLQLQIGQILINTRFNHQTSDSISDSDSIKVKPTLDEEISHDRNLQNFLLKTYKYTGGGVFATLATSQVLFSLLPNIENYYVHCWVIGTLTSLGSLIPLYIYQNKIEDPKYRIKKILSFGLLCLGMGIDLTPFMNLMYSISPTILPTSMLLTASVFAGSSLYAYRTTNNLVVYTAPLMGCLTGLVCVSLSSLIGGCLCGWDSSVFKVLSSIDTYGGLALFTVLVAYDTHVAVEHFKDKTGDYVDSSIELYLDFINLLVRIMSIVSKKTTDNVDEIM